MIDQRVSEGEKIKFFSKEAYTTTLPAQIALKYSWILCLFLLKEKNMGKFTMKVYDPINTSNFKNKLRPLKKIKSNTRKNDYKKSKSMDLDT